MAIEEFESVLKNAGFTPVANDALPLPTMPVTNAFRRPVLTGKKTIDGAEVEVQLQEASSVNGSGWACAARVTHPNVRGEGMFRPKPVWGIFRALTAGPKVAVALLAIFMLMGVGVVMLPGMVIFYWIRRAALSRLDVSPYPDLVIDALQSRYAVWGKDRARASEAFPATLQQAFAATDWFGATEVRDGTLLLDTPAGFGRVDLFENLVTASDAAAAAIAKGPRAITP